MAFEQRNKFSVGDEIEIMKPDGRNVGCRVVDFLTTDGEHRESAPHPKERLYVKLDPPEAESFDILRQQVPIG